MEILAHFLGVFLVLAWTWVLGLCILHWTRTLSLSLAPEHLMVLAPLSPCFLAPLPVRAHGLLPLGVLKVLIAVSPIPWGFNVFLTLPGELIVCLGRPLDYLFECCRGLGDGGPPPPPASACGRGAVDPPPAPGSGIVDFLLLFTLGRIFLGLVIKAGFLWVCL